MIASLFSDLWPYLAGLGAIIAALFAARRSGGQAEKRKNIIKQFEANEKTRERIDNAKPAKDAAAARANLANRLRKRGK